MDYRTLSMRTIWAKNGIEVPGGGPTPGTTYVKSSTSDITIENGWKYDTIVQSPEFNEVMKRLTTIVLNLEQYGVLPWCAETNYGAGALAMGSDMLYYQSLVANNLNHEPLTSSSQWTRYNPSIPNVPAGAVMSFAMNSAPAGWVACDGTGYSNIGQYANLYSAIGTTYGSGNGITTNFNVPDLRGYFVRGYGTNSDGATSGTFGQKIQDTFKEHNHSTKVISASAIADVAVTSIYGNTANLLPTTLTGSSETKPKNIAMLYCIKY